MSNQIVLSGKAHEQLGENLAKELGVDFGEVEITTFPNNESRIRIVSDVKDKDVIIVQPTIDEPDKHIIQLALLTNAARHCQAASITAVIPWFGYSPQDKVFRYGEPLSAEVMIKMLEAVGIDKFFLVDIHSGSLLELFSKEVIHLSALPIFVDHFKDSNVIVNKDEWRVVAVDKGGRERATNFAKELGLEVVFFDKSRDLSTGVVTFHSVKGEVKGKKLIAFDDFVSTGGTLIQSAEQLKELGAAEYHFCVTHVVVKDTLQKLEVSEVDRVITTNSIFIPEAEQYNNIEFIDISKFLAESISKSSLN